MIKRALTLLIMLSTSCVGHACTTCNRQIQKAIWNSTFVPNLLALLSAFIVIGIVVMVLASISTRRHSANISKKFSNRLNPVPLTTASTVLGIGLGGFIDGIVLHQILQWHEMLSNKIPPVDYVTKSVNMFWDGIFHAFCLVVVIVGVVLLWRLLRRNDIERSGNLLGGGLLLGWGVFNIVEGVIDHQILRLHNVREITNNTTLWNYGFLGASVVMLVVGFILTNKSPIGVNSNNDTNTFPL